MIKIKDNPLIWCLCQLPRGGRDLTLLSKALNDQATSNEPPSSIHKLIGSARYFFRRL